MKNNTSHPDTVYVLYGGTSVDGAGPGEYKGFTIHKDVAYKHLCEISKDKQYSVGYVLEYTQTGVKKIYPTLTGDLT